jgi:hypothetical protein
MNSLSKSKNEIRGLSLRPKDPLVAIEIEVEIGNGSTANYWASPEPMIIREVKISPQ